MPATFVSASRAQVPVLLARGRMCPDVCSSFSPVVAAGTEAARTRPWRWLRGTRGQLCREPSVTASSSAFLAPRLSFPICQKGMLVGPPSQGKGRWCTGNPGTGPGTRANCVHQPWSLQSWPAFLERKVAPAWGPPARAHALEPRCLSLDPSTATCLPRDLSRRPVFHMPHPPL